MCVVSINDFNRNPEKYFRIAESEQVMIKGNGQIFQLVQSIDEKEYISGEELIKRVHVHIDEKFADRK